LAGAVRRDELGAAVRLAACWAGRPAGRVLGAAFTLLAPRGAGFAALAAEGLAAARGVLAWAGRGLALAEPREAFGAAFEAFGAALGTLCDAVFFGAGFTAARLGDAALGD
jgi:hypothetical protein